MNEPQSTDKREISDEAICPSTLRWRRRREREGGFDKTGVRGNVKDAKRMAKRWEGAGRREVLLFLL